MTATRCFCAPSLRDARHAFAEAALRNRQQQPADAAALTAEAARLVREAHRWDRAHACPAWAAALADDGFAFWLDSLALPEATP